MKKVLWCYFRHSPYVYYLKYFYFFFQADADKIKELQEKLKEAKSKGDEVRIQSEKNSQSFQKTDLCQTYALKLPNVVEVYINLTHFNTMFHFLTR